MPRKRAKPISQRLDEPRQVSPDLQAGVQRFAKALGHLVLVKVNPEVARFMAEDQTR